LSLKVVHTLFILVMLIPGMELCAQPAKASAELQMLSTHSGYINDQSFYHVVGEVQNTGNITLTNIHVNVTLYNATNEIVAKIDTTTRLFYLLPGRVSPFDATLYSTIESQKVYNHTVEVAAFTPTQEVPIGLEISSSNSYPDSNGLNVNGTIENIAPTNIFFTRITATFYNYAGKAIAVVTNNSNPSTINISQTAPFQIFLSSSVTSQVDHYVLEAESGIAGTYYESVPEYQPLVFLAMLVLTTTVLGITAKTKNDRKRRVAGNAGGQCL